MSETSADASFVYAPKTGDAWGDLIQETRERELDAALAAWEAESDHGERKGPFDGKKLSGADVFYLAASALIGTNYLDNEDQIIREMPNARALLSHPTFRIGLNLPVLHLEGANLLSARLAGAYLQRARLDSAILTNADLSGSDLSSSSLIGARFMSAQGAGADLHATDLTDAKFDWSHFAGAFFNGARLIRATFNYAELMGANLQGADLTGADLRFATLDRATRLNAATLSGVYLDQIVLDNVNLSMVRWRGVAPLGDDKDAQKLTDVNGQRKPSQARIEEYEAAVRANRLLVVALRAQGLADDADIFAYRAQVCQRHVALLRHRFPEYYLSSFLNLFCAYGYSLGRVIVAYGLALVGFSLLYWHFGVHSHPREPMLQAMWDSFLVSLSAIHGRTVFEQLGPWSITAWIAAVESVFGILIEGILVGMVIQRLAR